MYLGFCLFDFVGACVFVRFSVHGMFSYACLCVYGTERIVSLLLSEPVGFQREQEPLPNSAKQGESNRGRRGVERDQGDEDK